MIYGYMGKILWVDLSEAEIREEALEPDLYRQFIGGYGLGAKVLYDRQRAGADPLGPDNTIGFVTAPFNGTPALSGARYVVVGKSPLTGSWGDSNAGGDFGPHLKYTGYDGVFITGKSQKPVYLLIKDGQAELRGAAHLWGKDSFETCDILKSELGKDVRVVAIGPAGEKLSLISGLISNDGRAMARSGLGAVIGSKRLKAVVVTGNMKIPLANETRAKELKRKYLKELNPAYFDQFRKYGTCGGVEPMTRIGWAPTKNWKGSGPVDFPGVSSISGDAVLAQEMKKYACHSCPIGCGGYMKEGRGEYRYAPGVKKPEYETLVSFGNMCLNSDLGSIIKINDICNRYGIDTISVGCTMAFAIECYENGLITKNDTEGIELTWSNHEAIVAMTEKLAKREGFGDILADGSKVAAEKIGKGAEQYAVHIQGQEVPMSDPRAGFAALAPSYVVDATPARHTQGWRVIPPGLPLPSVDEDSFSGIGEAIKTTNNFGHIVSCAGMCRFMFYMVPDASVVLEFLGTITGWDIGMEEALKTGERIANIRHIFNIREGLNFLQFRMPGRVVGKPPLTNGPLAGVTVDDRAMINDYLTAADWDKETGKPSKRKLQELNLDSAIEQLWP